MCIRDSYTAAQKNELYKVVSVPINDSGAFAETMRRWNEGKYKTCLLYTSLLEINIM